MNVNVTHGGAFNLTVSNDLSGSTFYFELRWNSDIEDAYSVHFSPSISINE